MKGVALILAAFAVIIAAGLALEDKPTPSREPASRLLTRGEFLDRCRVDRQIEACASAIGKPDRRQSGSGGSEAWYFSARTLDPVTGNTDGTAQVMVDHGVVRRVNFY